MAGREALIIVSNLAPNFVRCFDARGVWCGSVCRMSGFCVAAETQLTGWFVSAEVHGACARYVTVYGLQNP